MSWGEGVEMVVFEGPDEYLYGEESALLETIDGRWPFPRVVPTFRRGIRSAPGVDSTKSAPALVKNTETPSQRRPHSRPRPGLVPHRRHRAVAGHHRLHGHRLHAPPRGGRGPHGNTPGGGPRRDRRWATRGAPDQGCALRGGQQHHPRFSARHARQLGRPGRHRQRPGFGRFHGVRRHRRHDGGDGRFPRTEVEAGASPCGPATAARRLTRRSRSGARLRRTGERGAGRPRRVAVTGRAGPARS